LVGSWQTLVCECGFSSIILVFALCYGLIRGFRGLAVSGRSLHIGTASAFISLSLHAGTSSILHSPVICTFWFVLFAATTCSDYTDNAPKLQDAKWSALVAVLVILFVAVLGFSISRNYQWKLGMDENGNVFATRTKTNQTNTTSAVIFATPDLVTSGYGFRLRECLERIPQSAEFPSRIVFCMAPSAPPSKSEFAIYLSPQLYKEIDSCINIQHRSIVLFDVSRVILFQSHPIEMGSPRGNTVEKLEGNWIDPSYAWESILSAIFH
jgi:predicted membrane protein